MKKQLILLIFGLSALSLNAVQKKVLVKPYKIKIYNETRRDINIEFMSRKDQSRGGKRLVLLGKTEPKKGIYGFVKFDYYVKRIVVREGSGNRAQNIVAQRNVNIYRKTALNIIYSGGKYIIRANLQGDWFSGPF